MCDVSDTGVPCAETTLKILKFYGGRCSVSYRGVFAVVHSITATEGRKRGFDCPAPIVVEMSKTVFMLRQWDV
jgi:hypothetical protein